MAEIAISHVAGHGGAGNGNGVAAGIAREERAGLAYVFFGRLMALGMLAVWVATTLPFERSGAYLAAIALFALLGAPPYLLSRRGLGGWKVTAVFLLLDAAILTYILIVPPPFFTAGWTPQLNLRLPNFLYLGVFLVGMALSYSPALVIWAGVASIAAWSVGVLWVVNPPAPSPTARARCSTSGSAPTRSSATSSIRGRSGSPPGTTRSSSSCW